jgi:hypothetical protein
MDKRLSKIIIIVVVVLAVLVVAMLVAMNQQPQVYVGNIVERPKPVLAEEPIESEVVAPDGKFTAILTHLKNGDTINYKFIITNTKDGSQKEIFKRTTPVTSEMSLPDNTFSSDNKYVFLKLTDGGKDQYIVMRTDGEELLKDTQTLELVGMFYEKYSDFVVTDVTGWAGPTLLVVNSDKAEGGIGPSFWFDLSSRTFIKLSTRFN